MNLLLEFLDLRFVTGDVGLDKVTSWLGFMWEFEAILGNDLARKSLTASRSVC